MGGGRKEEEGGEKRSREEGGERREKGERGGRREERGERSTYDFCISGDE